MRVTCKTLQVRLQTKDQATPAEPIDSSFWKRALNRDFGLKNWEQDKSQFEIEYRVVSFKLRLPLDCTSRHYQLFSHCMDLKGFSLISLERKFREPKMAEEVQKKVNYFYKAYIGQQHALEVVNEQSAQTKEDRDSRFETLFSISKTVLDKQAKEINFNYFKSNASFSDYNVDRARDFVSSLLPKVDKSVKTDWKRASKQYEESRRVYDQFVELKKAIQEQNLLLQKKLIALSKQYCDGSQKSFTPQSILGILTNADQFIPDALKITFDSEEKYQVLKTKYLQQMNNAQAVSKTLRGRGTLERG